ncbi:MAG: hypothetical protein NVS3B10_06830 [Polyangiales bacterium]
MVRRILLDGLKTGLTLAATTTAAIMLFGKRQRGSAWSGINAISHVVDDARRFPRGFSARESAIGLGVTTAAMLGWGLLYRGALAAVGGRGGVVPAALATLAIGLVDYELLPARFSPGIERVLGPQAVATCYVVLGATLAFSDRLVTPRLLLGPHDEGSPEAWFV